MSSTNTHLVDALIAFGHGDHAAAAAAARRAAEVRPDSRVCAAAVTYLQRVCAQGRAGVYVTGEAFAAFIRGGGNLPLYASLSELLRTTYAGCGDIELFDIGVGDGMALLPAIHPHVARITLVEPSAPMLAQVCAALDARGVPYEAFRGDFLAFSRVDGRWDMGQATFSLQCLAPDDRREALSWLHGHCARLLVAEFDVPEFDDLYAPGRIEHFTTRYERGLAEYDGAGLVAQGFLMPVFFGCFDPSRARANYEQPIAA